MIIYFICGFSTCKDFAATSLLCQYLKMCYPNHFHYRKIVTHKDCYKSFAKALCEKYGWPEFTSSPMIWKQHDWAKSKATFLGDENKFQELMNEIYGVETFVPCEGAIRMAIAYYTEKYKRTLSQYNIVYLGQCRLIQNSKNKCVLRIKLLPVQSQINSISLT
ncbi:hypothetical protein WDU94_011339, partial [Cyamophila willieti]